MDCGIYKIENLKNNKKYIGSSKRISDRWSDHKAKLRNGLHYNNHLQNAWTKYGKKK